jgi:hypothetical protein
MSGEGEGVQGASSERHTIVLFVVLVLDRAPRGTSWRCVDAKRVAPALGRASHLSKRRVHASLANIDYRDRTGAACTTVKHIEIVTVGRYNHPKGLYAYRDLAANDFIISSRYHRDHVR